MTPLMPASWAHDLLVSRCVRPSRTLIRFFPDGQGSTVLSGRPYEVDENRNQSQVDARDHRFSNLWTEEMSPCFIQIQPARAMRAFAARTGAATMQTPQGPEANSARVLIFR